MTKRTSAKYKIDRRMGENIWGRPKSPVNKREYGPGQHGQRRKGKMSDFGTQLRAKQKLKGYYGDLTEKQFRRIYADAERLRGDTSEQLIGLLERRLDAVVYRAKFVPTIFAARQFVNHGHVAVNGRRVNIASYRVKEGDVVSVRDKSRQIALVLEALGRPERDVPEYLAVDHSKLTAEFVRAPALARRALPGDDGAEPRRRVLRQELIRSAPSRPRGPRGIRAAPCRCARRPREERRAMATTYPNHGRIDGPIVMIGFGSIGRGTLPLIERHFTYDPHDVHVIEPVGRAPHLPGAAGRAFHPPSRSPGRTTGRCSAQLFAGRRGFCVNLSVDTSSLDIMRLCRELGVLYIDTVVEPWAGLLLRPLARSAGGAPTTRCARRCGRRSARTPAAPRRSPAAAPTPAWCRGC